MRNIEVGAESPNPEAVVRLDPTATLVIRVVDAEGQPVPGVHVSISNADSVRGTPSFGYDVDQSGELRWEGTLRRWRVRIDDFDFVPSEGVIVKPEAGEEKIVRLTLPERR